ncbi:MAG: aspartate aminotransferase family protein [Gammaproteobacteria bacterium]|nr:aspartate aminotransferase family protein [Gammaproteobacteria bacterium]
MTDSIMNTYKSDSVSFTKGEGVYLWDSEGNRYLDAISGIAVCALGHADPEVAKAIADQASTLIHTSNLYTIDLQKKLADSLTELAGMDRAFFGNSGAEANEAAIKLARLYGHHKGIVDPLIVVTEQSFHGRTMATLTATGNRKVQAGFEPLLHGFVRVPYNDLPAIEKLVQHSRNIVAVLVEPIQGEGGVRVPDSGYLSGLRTLCDENEMLLMLDEIQTGMCRTGRWFAFQHENIVPDVMTLAKSLGNGFPIGACLAKGKAAEVFKPGNHGSTYGGNPLACRTALTVIEQMKAKSLDKQAALLGEQLLAELKSRLGSIGAVVEIRGKGLMIGIELDRPCAELVAAAKKKGLLINVTSDKVVRLLPPLIIDASHIKTIVSTLGDLIQEFVEA